MIGWRDARQGAGREERKLGARRFIFSHYYFKTRSKSFILFFPFFFWCAMSDIDGALFRQETLEFA